VPPRGSVAAHVQAAVPQCRVVAAFHHLPAKELGHLGEPIDSDVLICSDDPASIRTVAEIVSRIPGCRPLDAGELSNATAIEAFTAVLLQLNVRYRTRVAPKLTGIRA
jgi:8-hydroxy-5-deazaflavin:NADPH oxidoreductase